MISYLRGKVIWENPKSVIVDVNGVGYKLNIHSNFLPEKNNDLVNVWVYTASRENSLELFGFSNKGELEIFELLLNVSGIGPKTALQIVGLAGTQNIKEAILSGESGQLVKLYGISKKNAERIILELKGKVVIEKNGNMNNFDPSAKEDSDVLDALETMGYSEKDARETIKKLPKNISGTKSKLKEALRMLSK